MDIQPLLQLLARARANRIKRQVNQQSAAQVLAHQDGDASNPPAERNQDASPFYATV